MIKLAWWLWKWRTILLIGICLVWLVPMTLFSLFGYFCLDNYLVTFPIRILVWVYGVGSIIALLLLTLWPNMIQATPQAMAWLFPLRILFAIEWLFDRVLAGWRTAVP